ncbi:MAG: cell division protein [Alphaproteobacteria bacterium]|nr:MAG: cell division protein [Alphaproteobacteria bacterium]
MTRRVPFLSDRADRVSGRLLPWVIAVMVFLSGIALASALGVHDAVANWASDLGRRLTVQVVAADPADRDAQAAAAEALLASTPGVETVNRLDLGAITALLEPWLGKGNVGDDLPLPVLIDVTLAPDRLINTAALARQLREVAPDAALDTNEQWLSRLHAVAGMVEGTAVTVVGLVTLATVAIVIFGTHAGLAAHRETIETLHIIGARDNLIAGEFQVRFLKLGLKGGLIGLVAAGVTLVLGRSFLRSLGGGILDKVTLEPGDLVVLLVLPLAAGVIAMFTARLTVLRALARMV